jgi:hypothetical protein
MKLGRLTLDCKRQDITDRTSPLALKKSFLLTIPSRRANKSLPLEGGDTAKPWRKE